jgi:hypothetical protein
MGSLCPQKAGAVVVTVDLLDECKCGSFLDVVISPEAQRTVYVKPALGRIRDAG